MSNEKTYPCRVHGFCPPPAINAPYQPIFSVGGIGKILDCLKGHGLVSAGPDSEVFRFLCGDRIHVKKGRLAFTMPRRFLEKNQILTELSQENPVDDFANAVNQEALNQFLGNLFAKAIAGEATCSTSSLGDVDFRVVANSWNVLYLEPYEPAGRDMFHIAISFEADILLKTPIVPASNDQLKKGMRCHYFASRRGYVHDATNYKIAMGVLLCKEEVCVSPSGHFIAIKPRNLEEYKTILANELAAQEMTVCDFAGLASCLISDKNLKDRLLSIKPDDEFIPSPSYSGPANAGMFGWLRHRLYSGTPRVSWSLARVPIFPKTFEHDLEKFCENLARFMDHQEYEWLDERESVHKVRLFCLAMQEFCERYLSGSEKIGFFNSLVDFAWETVSENPLMFDDCENEFISRISREFISGDL